MKKVGTVKRVREKRKGFTNKICNITYDVAFHYSRQSKESMNDIIIRLIGNNMQGFSYFLIDRQQAFQHLLVSATYG